MKVVCETCGTKYSIDDNRVLGKAFKIRCKRCDRVIILRGKTAPSIGEAGSRGVGTPTALPAGRGSSPGGSIEPVPEADAWHVVIDGAQRPVELAELRRLRATGTLDDGSLVWREGWDDWRELGSVDELRDAGPPSVDVAPDADAAPVAPRPALRGERNETSVLFSLGDLARLAAPGPAATSPAAAGEGSGLLDIRSIARGLAPGGTRARTERGSFDDVPIHGGVTFAEPVVLVPERPRGRDRRLVWALAASIGMLLVVTTILLVVMVRDGGSAHAGVLTAAPGQPAGPATPQPSTAPTPRSATVAPPAAPASTAPAIQPAPAVPSAAAAGPAPAAPSVAQGAPVVAAPAMRMAPAASRRTAAHASSAPPITPRAPMTPPQVAAPPPLAPPPAHAAEPCSEVTCIVNGYADSCCQIYREPADRHPASPSPGASSLPENLNRAAIAAGLTRIDTSGCRRQSPAHGDVAVSIKVSAAGAVTAVTVKSSPDPALSACVTASAREGTFAPTQRGSSFAYVWRF